MNRLLSKLALPLLAKELSERAARKKTYIMRVVFALLLILGFGILIQQYTPSNYRAFYRAMSLLGRGEQLFKGLIVFQMWGIFLVLPAIAAGQLTLEKERDSLALLFLTRLGPWQIILEKYLSALIPVLSLLLVAMPMAAVAYAYGGVTQKMIGESIYVLLLTLLQAAALSLLCSAWCRTTMGAFLSTYFLGTLICFFPILVSGISYLLFDYRVPFNWMQWIDRIFAPSLLPATDKLGILPRSAPVWFSILLFLGLTRFFLVRRAFLKGANPALLLFQWLDRLMQHLNRWAGNVSFGKAQESLPGMHPVAWREMRRNVLARFHYLLRILLLVEIPTLFFGSAVWAGGTVDEMSMLIAFLGGMAMLAISVNAANAFVSERVNQTLDLLLTTPMCATQIVAEKARAMRRFLYIAAVPLLTLYLIEWRMKCSSYRYHKAVEDSTFIYLTCSILTIALYLPMVSWLSIWVGLKTRTRFQAIITALTGIVLWCGAPIVLTFVLTPRHHNLLESGWVLLLGLSPIFIPMLNESSEIHEIIFLSPLVIISIHFLLYGTLLYLIRRHCLGNADRYLRKH